MTFYDIAIQTLELLLYSYLLYSNDEPNQLSGNNLGCYQMHSAVPCAKYNDEDNDNTTAAPNRRADLKQRQKIPSAPKTATALPLISLPLPHFESLFLAQSLSPLFIPLPRSIPTPSLVYAMSAWSVKTRRAPSRHSTDAKVYGHMTTAMRAASKPPSCSHT